MMHVLAHGVLIISIAYVYYRKQGSETAVLFWSAWCVRMVMGAALGLVYLYYYSANDTWLFFTDANALAHLARNDFSGYLQFLFTDESKSEIAAVLINSGERSVFFIKWLSVFSFVSGDNYWISAGWFSLISFMAAWHLFTVICRLFEGARAAAALAFLFFPSVIFWSSGLVKETLALAGLYFATGLFLKIMKAVNGSWAEWLLAIIGVYVAWNLKYYWTALFGAVVFTTLAIHWAERKFQRSSSFSTLAWLLLFLVVAAIASLVHPNFYLSRFLEVLVTNHDDFVKLSSPDGIIHFYDLKATWWSVMINAPWALFSGLFRPWFWEASGVTALLASAENLFIVVLLLASFRQGTRVQANRLLVLAVMVYCALLCIFLALSTPNFGTLSRYRVGFLPFLIFVWSYGNPLTGWMERRIG
jgi:hypothetical protein